MNRMMSGELSNGLYLFRAAAILRIFGLTNARQLGYYAVQQSVGQK